MGVAPGGFEACGNVADVEVGNVTDNFNPDFIIKYPAAKMATIKIKINMAAKPCLPPGMTFFFTTQVFTLHIKLSTDIEYDLGMKKFVIK